MPARRFNFPIAPALAVFTALVALLLYLPVRAFQFVGWDDFDLVRDNAWLHPASWDHLKLFWQHPCRNLYTPLAYTSWWLLIRLFGDPANAEAFHLFNLLLHVAAVALVFEILRAICESPWAAAAGALLFAVHPIQVEPIAWVSGMNNLLAAVFTLVAIRLHLRAIESPKRRRLFATVALAAFALALLSKPTAVIAPLLAGILDYFQTHRPLKRIAISLLPWAGLAILFSFIARNVQTELGPPLWLRPLIAGDTIAFYLAKIFWPIHFSIDYARTPQFVRQNQPYLYTVPILAILAIILWLLRRRQPQLLTAFLLIIATLLPLLGFIPFSMQRYSTVADRYAYLAMLGPALALSIALTCTRSRMSWTAASLALILLAAQARAQIFNWRNTAALANHTLQLDPHSTVGNKILGFLLASENHYNAAATHYRAALERAPDDGDLHYNLANSLLRINQLPDAIAEYQIAISFMHPPHSYLVMNNLGIAYATADRPDLAEQEFRLVLAQDPTNTEAAANLAHLLAKAAATRPAPR